MVPDSHLPSDAVRAILEFMDRKQLEKFAAVNRQFYFVTNSLPFTERPVLRIRNLSIHNNPTPLSMEWRVWWTNVGLPYFGPALGDTLESFLEPRWLRITSVDFVLPYAHEEAPAQLKLLEKNFHCLHGAEHLYVQRNIIAEERGEGIPPEIAEIVDKIKSRFEAVRRR